MKIEEKYEKTQFNSHCSVEEIIDASIESINVEVAKRGKTVNCRVSNTPSSYSLIPLLWKTAFLETLIDLSNKTNYAELLFFHARKGVNIVFRDWVPTEDFFTQSEIVYKLKYLEEIFPNRDCAIEMYLETEIETKSLMLRLIFKL